MHHKRSGYAIVSIALHARLSKCSYHKNVVDEYKYEKFEFDEHNSSPAL